VGPGASLDTVPKKKVFPLSLPEVDPQSSGPARSVVTILTELP